MSEVSTHTFAGRIRKPNPHDAHIGARLRACRTLAGFSQEKLAAAVGLSFQQVQKYEKGLNRIGGSRLQQFAQILNVQPGYFFEDLPGNEISIERVPAGMRAEHLKLVQDYDRLPSDEIRGAVRALVKQLAKAGAPLEAGEAA